ncbi:MAG: exodeoxyribonuclease VII small subunit [Proteobacteria bacterium]|nr:exodeoxyribonuclease VII small subunit [Desulfobacteraceae bacterium]MBU2521747.1 exodeoxyribonuclease VII small subunit [Pseudomonadota bacterium]MBU3979998.1 exodeoxyribonuclease VII small subunit [Pseudomonadota bacterium]MBU4014404.1 exodeoxyribonuclease VII small subunit [Pseudomonadota bacterium]MBU4068159.1 exodeoxyribonuclease VII small subunit [Pseudomonadota bacterium]
MAKISFEKSLKQLEQIVQELESGNLPLEKAMQKFEEGVKLSKFCSEKLDETEKKISVLLRDNKGDITEEPFMPENETEDD